MCECDEYEGGHCQAARLEKGVAGPDVGQSMLCGVDAAAPARRRMHLAAVVGEEDWGL